MYSITLTKLTEESDLRAIIGAICSVLNIDKRSAIEKAKNLPLVLAENLPQNEAELMVNMFEGMGALIKVEPELNATPAVPLREPREIRTELPKRGIHWGCLVFIMLCLAGFAAFASLKYQWIMEQFKPSPAKAEKLLLKGNIGKARQSIRRQLSEKPNDTDLLILQGKYYIGAARKKMDAQQWKSYGEAGAMPELDSAVAFFRKAESLNSKDGSIPRWISVAELMRGSLDEAETAARRAISIESQDADNWNQLGSVLVSMEQTSQAEQMFSNALKISPNNAAALRNLGILNLYYTKDTPRAANFIFAYYNQKEASTDMDSYQLRTDLATAMIGDFNPPLERLWPQALPFEEYESKRSQLTANPKLKNDYMLQEDLGLLYMSKGEMLAAEDCFMKAIRLNPKAESSRKMLAIMYMKEESYEKALGIMQAAAKNRTRDAFFWKNIGFLQKYYKIDAAEANRAWNRYFTLGGDSYETRVRKERQ
jgi:tetratricopeptide (TPR) repeat protein